MEWIMSCNTNYYDLDDAFHDLGSIEWQIRSNIQKGDVCYIYVGHSDRAVRYKCIAVSEIRDKTTIDDRLYGGNSIGIPYKCIEIKPIGYYVGEGIKYDELKERGLNFSIRGQIKLKDEWGKYISDYKALDYELKDEYDLKNESDSLSKEIESIVGYDKESYIKSRRNQGYFRSLMIEKYDGKCCLCGMSNCFLLVASHIKPWSESSSKEKVSEHNGLLLCPNHDALFDKGFISFDAKGKILISSILSDEDCELMNINRKMKIKLEKEQEEFLKYHREQIYWTED